ncbi:double-stranded RNA-binding protein 1-like [Prosopis cineraria]|uniref:double-stranded RNA-binding protein 1-like n=1 Tax=Prosopis cineraria TaxID=364024 RepID=UPI00240FC49E|nr:double-stranded RNA-binding protein 1-like [Prosopis cineraria]
MYKTKLQELCHQKRWVLPRYSAMKDGPDHIPSFKASVSVNGLTFDSLVPRSSSKLAQNEAAMLAFLHFTSSDPPSPSPATDLNQLRKSQLRNYDQRKSFDSTAFTIESSGLPHIPCMNATSSVDDQRYERPAIFSTSKEAEQAAEKVSLMSLSLDSPQKGDSGLYKNLLQELALRAGFCIPTYKTIKSGTVRMPTFISIVEVEGKDFHGEARKSKKQAEQDAAKVAYTALKESRSILLQCCISFILQNGYPSSLINLILGEFVILLSFSSQSHITNRLCMLHAWQSVSTEEAQEQNLDEMLPSMVKVSNEISNPSFLQPSEEDMMKSIKSLPSSESVHESPEKECPSSPESSQLDLSALSIPELNNAKTPETSSYLIHDRIRVYTSFPDLSLPEGITLLPIRENRWIAVSLEFPDEKDN